MKKSSPVPQKGAVAAASGWVQWNMLLTAGELWRLLTATGLKWWDDNALRLSAALSYYTLFSLAPLLIIAIAVAGFVFGEKAVQGELMGQIQGFVGADSALAIQGMIESARKPSAGVFATVISLVTLVVASTGVFAELQDALNTIWKIKPRTGRGITGAARDRFMSFVLVIGVGFLLIVSLILSAALAAAGKFLDQLLPGPEFMMHIVNFLVSFAVITLLFALMYKVLPDAHIAWDDVWIGAVVTALLFTVGKFLIGMYIGKSAVASTYGAAGSLVVILVWVYYSAMILFFGAEFTFVYANQYGSHIGAQSLAAESKEDDASLNRRLA